jgi:hypothetical protein
VRLKSRARRQAQRKTRNSDERPGDGLMTVFLEFANPADIFLARDSAAVLALACRKSQRRGCMFCSGAKASSVNRLGFMSIPLTGDGLYLFLEEIAGLSSARTSRRLSNTAPFRPSHLDTAAIISAALPPWRLP